MELELPHRSKDSENSMHYSQPQRYIVSMLLLLSHLLVFETHFDSYFYNFFVSHFDSCNFSFLFYEFYFIAILYVSCNFSFYAVSAFFQVFLVLLRSGYDAHLKPRHGQITAILSNLERYASFAINVVNFIDWSQFILSSLDKLFNNLCIDQFRETKKYLESFYIQQPNQP